MANNNPNKGLKSIPNYIKNVTKSAMYAGGDFIGDVMPATKSFVDTNTNIFKSIANDMRNFKGITKQVSRQIGQSEMYTSAKKYKTNMMEDLKSGNLYNKSRQEQYDVNAAGFGDLFDMSDFESGFDMNFDDENSDGLDFSISKGDVLTAGTIEKTSNNIINMTASVGNVIAETSVKSAEMITSNQQNIYTMNTINNYRMFTEINNVLGDMATNIRGLFEYTRNTTDFYNSTLKMNEDMSNKLSEMAALNKEYTEMQRNLYKEYDKSRQSSYTTNKTEDMFDAYGGINFENYFNNIGKNIKEQWQGSMFGSSMNMFGDSSNPLLSLAGSPLSFIPKKIISKLVSQNLKDSMGSFDKTMSGFFKSGLLKFSSMAKRKGEDNPIFDYLYKIFGVEVGQTAGLKTDKFVKGPVPLDGIMRQSIIEVIPGYLRIIAAAVSGSQQKVYNYESGKFENISDTIKRRDDVIKGAYSKVDETGNKVKSVMDESFMFSEELDKSIKKDTDKFFRFLADKGYFFNPRKTTYEDMNESGLYLDNEKSFDIINGILKTMGSDSWQELNQQILESVEYSKNYFEDINKKLVETGLSSAENGLTDLKKETFKPVDKFNKSTIDYVRDIRSILLEGIRVFVSGGSSKNSGEYNDIMNRRSDLYNEDVLQNTKNKKSSYKASPELASKSNKKYISDINDIELDSDKFNNYVASKYAKMSENKSDETKGVIDLDKIADKIKPTPFSNIKTVGKNILSAPSKIFTNILDNMNTSMITFLYGVDSEGKDKVSLFDSINTKVNDMINRTSLWLNEKVIDPLNKALFDPTNGLVTKFNNSFNKLKSRLFGEFSNGKSDNGLFSPVVNGVLDAKDYVINGIVGKEFTSRITGNKISKNDTTVLGEFKNMVSSIKSVFVKDMDSDKPTFIDTLNESVQYKLGSISNTMFGTHDEKLSPTQFYNLNIKDRMSKIGFGGISGLALSLFTPLGIFGGTLMGGAMGALSTSERFKNKMFGEIGTDGQRTGGIVPKQYLDTVKKSLPNVYKGIGIGALSSMITPFGFVGSAVLGGGLGFASSTEKVKSVLFGKMGEDGTRDDATALINKELRDKLKIKLPGMAKGAGLGLVGSFFLPGGPITGSLLGLSASIAGQSNTVKTLLFGDIDPATEKRQGGLFGRFKLWFKSDVMMPVKNMMDDFKAKGLYWIKKSIVNPLLDSFAPLKKQAEIMKDNLIENIKSGFLVTKDFVGSVFEKHVGKPFGKLIEEKFINPLKSFFKNTFGRLGKAFLGVLAAPFAGINKVAMGYKDKHVKMGVADYLDDWKEKKKARDNKTEEDYNKSRKKIKGDKTKISLIQKLMLAGKYDINHPATIKAISMMDNDISPFRHKPTVNPIKDNLSDINKKSSDIADNTSKMEGSLDYIKNLMSSTFGRFFHKDDKIKDVKVKKPKDNINGINIVNSDTLDNPENAKAYKNENTPTILLRVYDKLDSLSKIKLRNINAKNIKTPKSRIKRESDGIFDYSDDEGESGSDIRKNKIDFGGINKPKSLSYNINNISMKTKDIYDEIKGQLNNVGYNTELIANILTEKFGAPSMMPKGIRRGIHSLKSKLSSPFKLISSFIQAPFKFMAGLVKPVTTVVGEVIKSITTIPKAILGTINEIAKGAVSLVTNAFKAIPAIINVVATTLVETTKVIGAVSVEVVKGVGTLARATGEALGHLGVGIVKLTTEAIPLAFKAVNAVATAGFELIKGLYSITKNVLAVPLKAIFRGFDGRRNARDRMNITNIKNLEFVKLIDNINTVGTVKVIEKIDDPHLYSVLNNILDATKGNSSPINTNTNVNNDNGDNSPTNNIFDSIKNASNNVVNSVKTNLDKITNKNKASIAKFNAKEKADEDELTQKKVNNALIEGAKADKGTFEILKGVMDSKKGLFGKLFTIFQLIYNGLKAAKGKLFDWGGKLLQKFTDGKLFDPLVGKLENIFKNKAKDAGKEIVGEVAENAVKQGAVEVTENVMKQGAKEVGNLGVNNVLKKGAGKGAERLLGTGAKEVAEKGVKSTALALVDSTAKNTTFGAIDAVTKYGAENIVEATFKVADDVVTDPSIITKIFSSAPMKKLCGSKIGQFLPKIGKAIAEKLSKVGGSKIFAKISAKWAGMVGAGAASGGIIPAIWYGGTILNGISATNRMFEVSPNFKPTMLMRTIAGIAAFISENITWGLIPDKWICQLIAGFVLSDDEQSRIGQGNQSLIAEHEKYIAENGSEMTFSDYNKKVANRSLMTKTIDGAKNIGHVLTGNAFKDDNVRQIQGLGENDPITIGNRLRTFGDSSLSVLSLGTVKPEEVRKTFDVVSRVTVNYLNKAKDFFSTLDDKFLDAMDTTNATIGAIFNLTDRDGNPINFTKWSKERFDDMGKAIGQAAANAKRKAHEIWGSINDKYTEFKQTIGKGVEVLDKSFGAMCGLTNSDGSVMKMSDWIKTNTKLGIDIISDKMNSALNAAKSVWEGIGDVYDKLKTKVQDGASKLDDGIGNLFGLNDSEGNSTSLSGWVSNGWNNFKSRVSVRKTRGIGGKGSFGLTNSSSDNLNGAAYFSQYDSRWADTMYLPTENIKQAGCGPTSAAMVISSVTGQTVTPPEVAEYSVAHGHMHPDLGTSWSLFPDLGQKYGIGLNQTNDFDAAASALSQGRPVIFSGQGPAPFTSGGHFVVGVGMTSDGKVIINDPISQDRSKPYDFNQLKSSSAAAWISSKSLTGGTIASGNNNKSESESGSTDITNPFTKAIGDLGALTTGLVTSAFTGEVFDADKVLFPERNNSTVSAGSLSGFSGTPTDMDFDFNSINPIGTSSKNNKTYGRDAIRSTPGGNQAFINALAPQAIRSQEEFGIPASTVMAQAILESGWGKSTIGNNVFGIKEGSGYQGPVVSTQTSEYSGGSAMSITDTFRGYNSISEAVYDHAKNVIAGNPQYYSGVITKDWRQSIQGLSPYYATDPNYTNLLESVIKDNDLTQFNNMSSSSLGGGRGGNVSNVRTMTPKPINVQQHMAESLRFANEQINNVISAKNISEQMTNQLPYDIIIRLLQSISDNTAVTAQNTMELINKEFNVNVQYENNKDNLEQDNIEDNKSPSNKRNPFNNIAERKSNSNVGDAYSKAKQFATGFRN